MFDTLPLYFAFLGTAIGLMVVALGLYIVITPYSEIRLIRDGNSAAAISLSGTAIGLAITLYSTATGSHSVLDLAAWGVVGLISQLVVFFIVSFAIPGFRRGIEENRLSYGIVLGAFSIAMGILNAGSLST